MHRFISIFWGSDRGAENQILVKIDKNTRKAAQNDIVNFIPEIRKLNIPADTIILNVNIPYT
jgi:hypothetical protein